MPGGALLLALLAVPLGACRDREPAKPAFQGPIVLITVDALRADAIAPFGGSPRLTPAFAELAQQATWSGRAVSSSSWTVPAMATLFTGLQPWRNQSFGGDGAVLPESAVTLPEALEGLGFVTTGFRSNTWLKKQFGYAQGFHDFRDYKEGKRAEAHLAGLQGGRDFVWIHILPPHAPYVRREPLRDRLEGAPANLPEKVRPLDLEPYFDPDVPLPPEQARIFRAMYDLNVAFADHLVGRLLAALKKSGHWDDALLVVTADHGEEFGESGQVEHGGNLGRQLIEVPLFVKLPKGWKGPALELRQGERPGTAAVRATLVEAAGGTAEAGTAPSLFHKRHGGVLSELYRGNGVNRFSLVDGDLQVMWESRFAPAEPDYYRAKYAALGGQPSPPLAVDPEQVFARLGEQFTKVKPLMGLPGEQPVLTLWRWGASGAQPVDDPRQAQQMARRLRAAWLAANGGEAAPGVMLKARPELTREEEAELRANGYIQ